MTIEDLREQGVLLPEAEWGTHRLETTVPRIPFALGLVGGAAAWLIALLGDGGTLTWVGVGAFLLVFFAVTWVVDRAVVRLRQRVRGARRDRTDRSA